jgi:hypothetical protein
MVRCSLLAAAAVVGIGCAVWMGIDTRAVGPLATVAGLCVGIASLLLALVDFFRQEPARPDPAALADDLALRLREQWLEEAEARQLRDPRVLPLTWTTTSRDVVDTPRAGAASARVLRIRLDGRLDGRFDEVIGRLAAGYAQVPNRRLVAIGDPGSGKTVLAILLTLGLLGVREPGGPVPVLLPVSSWDPVRERLDDWIVRTLAQPYYNGRVEIPRALLTHGVLLPVLDGLDEIPESARRSAIRGINHAIGGERPIVVTCRATEYEELIRGGAPTLCRAAVVEVSPVPPEDVITYLREVDWPAGVDWEPVFVRMRTEPDSAVGDALSTPLMVTSARLVYQRGGGDPGELLDGDRFDCAYAVEDHLTHGLVDAAYAADPDRLEGAAARDRWTAEQARRWLTFLACYLHDRRERDLAWWLMSGRLLSPWAGPVGGPSAARARGDDLSYGQCAIATALNNLSAAGHLRRVRRPVTVDGCPRWVWHTFFSRTARDDAWWDAFVAGEVPVTEPPSSEAARSAAYDVLARLGRIDPRLTLSAGECRALEEQATEWLARGAGEAQLVQAVTAGLPERVAHAYGFVRARLLAKLPPPEPEPRTPRYEVVCTACGEPGGDGGLSGGLCGGCWGGRPALAADRVHTHVERLRAALRTGTRAEKGAGA